MLCYIKNPKNVFQDFLHQIMQTCVCSTLSRLKLFVNVETSSVLENDSHLSQVQDVLHFPKELFFLFHLLFILAF